VIAVLAAFLRFPVLLNYFEIATGGFSGWFFLATVFILTGGFFTVWFADFAYPTTSLRWHTVLPTFAPQIDVSFSIDETRISLLLAFFLLGGGEDDEDEDFILSEQGDLEGAEDVVAPRFFSNLGTTRAENSGLYLKRCAIFSFILANNLRGRLPYADTATASLGLTFWVARASFGSLLAVRIQKHGFAYLLSLFRPSGTPFPLLFLLVPIEALSFSFRLVSLAVRLFANRRAGHTLRKVLIGFAYAFLTLGDLYALASFLPSLVVFVLTFLERGVAAVQAYIFTTLRRRYRKDIYVAH
jgi:ATP synthase subunit 6